MQKISQDGDTDLIIKMIDYSLLRRKLKFKTYLSEFKKDINELGKYLQFINKKENVLKF